MYAWKSTVVALCPGRASSEEGHVEPHLDRLILPPAGTNSRSTTCRHSDAAVVIGIIMRFTARPAPAGAHGCTARADVSPAVASPSVPSGLVARDLATRRARS